MRFVCLVRGDDAALDALPAEKMRKLVDDSLAYDKELEKSGHMVVAHALHSPSQALALRSRGGKIVTVDGPFSETKEHVLGFILIEARDFNDAVGVAEKIPLIEYGAIELRQIADIEGSADAQQS